MRFEAPWVLLLLLVVPVLVYFFRRGKKRVSLRFSSTATLKQVKPSWRQRILNTPFVLRICCLLIIIVALARPQQGRERVRDISKGIAIEMVIDRSSSMSAEMSFESEQLNRLEVAKKVFEEFVSGQGGGLQGRPNDLIGMISFARYADTSCPLTLAHGALAQFLNSVKLVTQREEDGTAIGDALALAAARLKTAEETLSKQMIGEKKEFEVKSKIIILLTDGQSNAGKRTPQEAAQLAKEWGIKIYTIGVGGGEGLVRQQGVFGSFLMRMGEGVDRQTLQTIAEITGGIFRMAEDADALRAVYKEIDALERSEVESLRYLDYRELFQPFALAALMLLMVEVLLSSTIFRRIP